MNIWTGARRSSVTEIVDEFGDTFNGTEFADKIGVDLTGDLSNLIGFQFPKSVLMTNEFRLRTDMASDKCVCLCKSFDIPSWQG